MKSTRTWLGLLCALAAAGLAIGVVVERQSGFKLTQANVGLHQQLSQVSGLIAENQRLSNLVAQANGAPSRTIERPEVPSATNERVKELLRLRGEVEALRQQSKEIEALREDTRQVRAARESGLRAPSAGPAGITANGALVNGSPFEILSAEYGTESNHLDVAAELSQRIRSDGLKAVASNNIKGDPDFGHGKRLTVVYRFGGVTRTNEFQEGEVVVLPGEQTPGLEPSQPGP